MSNTITINFIPCAPSPASGYRVKWRVAGSGDPYTDEGLFTSSPAVFIDAINPAGTCYEGIIQSECTESGESGSLVGNEVPWLTPCDESGGTTYTIELTSPCFGNIDSNYLVSGGAEGDIVTVRATFSGVIQKIGGSFTRANLSIFGAGGTSEFSASGCYEDELFHGFSITADTVITMTGPTAVVTVSAVTHNSNATMTSVYVTIIDVNGTPHNVSVAGCRGNSSTGGSC